MPKVIVITGPGLGKTTLTRLLSDTYGAGNIPCKVLHYPSDRLYIPEDGPGFLIIDVVSGHENNAALRRLKPWQVITVSGGHPPADPSESPLLRTSSECEYCSYFHMLHSNRNPQHVKRSSRVPDHQCIHDHAILRKTDTRLSHSVLSYNRSAPDSSLFQHP